MARGGEDTPGSRGPTATSPSWTPRMQLLACDAGRRACERLPAEDRCHADDLIAQEVQASPRTQLSAWVVERHGPLPMCYMNLSPDSRAL